MTAEFKQSLLGKTRPLSPYSARAREELFKQKKGCVSNPTTLIGCS